jgi:hypothetical protein
MFGSTTQRKSFRYTVKTIPTELWTSKSAGIKLIYVALQVTAHCDYHTFTFLRPLALSMTVTETIVGCSAPSPPSDSPNWNAQLTGTIFVIHGSVE